MYGIGHFLYKLLETAVIVYVVFIYTMLTLWVISGVGLALLVFVWHGHPVWTGIAGTFFVGLPLLYILDRYLSRK